MWLGLLLATAGGGAGALYVGMRSDPEARIVTPARKPAVLGLGYFEPTTAVVKIGAPGNSDSSRVAELRVSEGERVEAGQVLAILDTSDRLRAQVEASEAAVGLKRLLLERQKLEIVATVEARRAALERARADLDSAQAEFDRQQGLVERNFATLSNLEKKKRELRSARATVAETDAARRRIEARTKTAGGGLIDVAVAEGELASAEADLRVARASLDQACIRAPFPGRILRVNARAGERVSAEGLLEIGGTDLMRAVIEVYQTDIGRVRLGETVTLRADALAAPVKGVVERVGAAVRRQSIVNNDPATATDARVVEVFVALDREISTRVANLSRLQVQGLFSR